MPRLILAAALMSLGGCANNVSQLPPVESVADQTYRLGPGDELRVVVYGFDSMTNAYTVSDAGTISLPLISSLEVEGLSTAELETAISGQLRTRDLAPRASVSVQVQKFRPFYILGEVQRPGQYPYVPGMTVLTAVSIAGGYTFRANKQDAELIRTRKRVSYRARAGSDARVLPGDTLMVPEAWF
ncbi:MAG: polysaccharide biosynthesis/export family protein [Sphingomonas sp.]